MPLLEIQDLTVEYHTDAGIFRAVEHLNLCLEQGKSLGLVGESGCGKTTAMLALMRLLPDAGRIVGAGFSLRARTTSIRSTSCGSHRPKCARTAGARFLWSFRAR